MTKKREEAPIMTSLGKKMNANADALRQIQDQLLHLQKEDNEEKVQSFQEELKNQEKTKKLVDFLEPKELPLREFLMSNMGNQVKQMLALMENPEISEWQALESWWTVQKIRWNVGESDKNLTTMYRALSWWASQFQMTITSLLTEFMINPFALSLQEICHKVAFIRNILHSMGFIEHSEAKVKWAEPFIEMSKLYKRKCYKNLFNTQTLGSELNINFE